MARIVGHLEGCEKERDMGMILPKEQDLEYCSSLVIVGRQPRRTPPHHYPQH